MNLKIGVIGGGWYGCHLSMMLDAMGAEVHLFEKNSRLLHEASGNNQYRLHLGFHYARNHRTRVQSRDGYSRFKERYPSLSKTITNNLYAIPRYDSLLDFQTYRLVMISSGINFYELREDEWPSDITNVEGVIRVDEEVLLVDEARQYFYNALHSQLRLNHKVDVIKQSKDSVTVDGESFDFVIDATWGHLASLEYQCFYEPTLLLYYNYEGDDEFPAVTLVDGPLCSLYPTEIKGQYTLSSVTHTPLGRFDSSEEAKVRLRSITDKEVADKVELMEEHIQKYIPGFKNKFSYIGPQYSIKTKLLGENDDRSCYVSTDNRVISVFSGKIDTIFFAAQQVFDYLERYKHH